MNQLHLQIQGPNAQQLSDELAKLIEQELGKQPPLPSSITDEAHKSFDPTTLAVLAIVLATPGFINETMKLSERMKLAQKFQTIIDWCKQKSSDHPDDSIRIPTEQGYKDLGHVEPADIFRALETYRT